MGSVYLLTNIINNKKYVGKTSRPIKMRLNEHFKNSSKKCRYLSRAISKYGKEAFICSILFESDDIKELNNKEIELIKELNTTSPNGYNLTLGGEGAVFTEEIKQYISNKLKGRNNDWAKKKITAIHVITHEQINFESILDAEKAGFKRRQINEAMKIRKGINSYKEYYWVYTEHVSTFKIPEKPQDKRSGHTFKPKQVIVENTILKPINIYKSINSCVKIYGNKKYILQCLYGLRNDYKNCKFSFKR